MRRREVLAAMGVTATGGLAGCLGEEAPSFDLWSPGDDSWPLMRYGPQNGRMNPHAEPPTGDVAQRWRESVDGSLYGAVGQDGVIVAFGEGGIWAFSTANGEELWSQSGNARAAGIFDGMVYVADQVDGEEALNSSLRAFDLNNGDQQFNLTDLGSPLRLTDLAVSESYVIVGSQDAINVVDRNEEELRWHVDDGWAVGLQREQLVVGRRGSLTALEPDAGRFETSLSPSWSAPTVTADGIPSPSCAERRIITGDRTTPFDDRRAAMHAYDGADGQKLWTNEPRGQWCSSPAIVGDIGFGVHAMRDRMQSEVVAVDLLDGRERWHVPFEGEFTQVIATEDLLLVYGNEQGTVLALDHEGTSQWEYTADAAIGWQSGVIMMGERVYAATDGGEIVALEAA